MKIQNMQNAYESAEQRNSSSAWKEFLSEYPNHNEASNIKKKNLLKIIKRMKK